MAAARLARALAALAAALACWAPAAGAQSNIISTVAGTGTAGAAGDNGPATQAELAVPADVKVTPDGGFLIAEQGNATVRLVSPSGIITRVAGTGTAGYADGPALSAQFNAPSGTAVMADGSILVADANNNAIRQIATDGTVTTVVGALGAGYNGDGIPANTAQVNFPFDVALTPDGGYLIADTDNNRVRKVLGGTISTVAGTGAPGSAGDNGPATSAQVNEPSGVALTPDGGFLIAETNGNRVRRVAPDGTITTAAGTGAPGSAGDGGPATSAELNAPIRVAVTTDGGFLIADRFNHRVRRVAPDGTITTVAGTGNAGFNGDGQVATSADLNNPFGVAVTVEGDFLIADLSNQRVRFVDAVGTLFALTPQDQTRTTGETATVEAALTRTDGSAFAGVPIRYSIAGANPGSGEVTTGPGGRVSISWLGKVPAGDSLSAFADLDGDDVADAGEPTATATVQWTGDGVPTAGTDVVFTELRGRVLVRPPPGVTFPKALRSGARSAQGRFVRLTEPALIPIGSVVKVDRGAVGMTAASNLTGGTQKGTFSKGTFRIRQRRVSRPVTNLKLVGGSFRPCRNLARNSAQTAQRRRRIRRLRGNARGRFRTRGRYGAATVRGTRWVMEDRCNGTLTRVISGRVLVRDFARRRNVVVRRGERYLARPRRG